MLWRCERGHAFAIADAPRPVGIPKRGRFDGCVVWLVDIEPVPAFGQTPWKR
jgi:hypothetical protein